jgi:hypothetical protein
MWVMGVMGDRVGLLYCAMRWVFCSDSEKHEGTGLGYCSFFVWRDGGRYFMQRWYVEELLLIIYHGYLVTVP